MKPSGVLCCCRDVGWRSDRSLDAAAKSWVNRVNQLKSFITQNPNENIPEIQFLLDWQWLSAVSNGGTENKDFTTRSDYEYAVERLRANAETQFAQRVQAGQQKYAAANADQVPADILQLQQYCEPEVRDVLLQSYEIKLKRTLPESAIGDVTIKADWFIARKVPAHPSSTTRFAIFPYNQIHWSSSR